MTWEELRALVAAREAIKNFAVGIGSTVDELSEPYKGAYEKLDEVIKRWETIP